MRSLALTALALTAAVTPALAGSPPVEIIPPPEVVLTTPAFHIAASDTSCWSARPKGNLVCYHRGTGVWAKFSRTGKVSRQRYRTAVRRPGSRLISAWSRNGFYCSLRGARTVCVAPSDPRAGGLYISPKGIRRTDS